jgi:hypothetical protein
MLRQNKDSRQGKGNKNDGNIRIDTGSGNRLIRQISPTGQENKEESTCKGRFGKAFRSGKQLSQALPAPGNRGKETAAKIMATLGSIQYPVRKPN